MAEPLALLYSGGTLGSAGHPLAPLSGDQLKPHLMTFVRSLTSSPLEYHGLTPIDSSALAPAYWGELLSLIDDLYQRGITRMVLIHGTDTLAYTSAFLAEALAGTDITCVVTGSQYPLLHRLSSASGLSLNADSDAVDNLKTAISSALGRRAGVWVAFNEEIWPAQTVQKIHTRDRSAFSGHARAGYPATSYQELSSRMRERAAVNFSAKLETAVPRLASLCIRTVYLMPQSLAEIERALESALSSETGYVDAVILQAYGLGNLPESDRIKALLKAAKIRGVLVALTTQVPYGGTEARYAAGSWLEGLVLPTARLTLAAVYARLAWLSVAYDTPADRRRRWTTILNDERVLARDDYRF